MKQTQQAPSGRKRRLQLRKGDRVINAQRHLFEEITSVSAKSNEYYGLEAEILRVDKKGGTVAAYYPSLDRLITQDIADFELTR